MAYTYELVLIGFQIRPRRVSIALVYRWATFNGINLLPSLARRTFTIGVTSNLHLKETHVSFPIYRLHTSMSSIYFHLWVLAHTLVRTLLYTSFFHSRIYLPHIMILEIFNGTLGARYSPIFHDIDSLILIFATSSSNHVGSHPT